MNRLNRLVRIALLVSLVSLTLATPALAFDGRGGETVVVAASEVINDDLYVGATEFVLDGTVNGDVLAGGQTITINGTITGNLLAGANTVVINGTVEGDVLAGAAVLFWGPESKVGGDVLGAGASLEFRDGSQVGRDALLAGGQVLLAGDVARNVKVGAGGLEIAGIIGGDVDAQVGEPSSGQPPPTMWTGQSPVPVPRVEPGLRIDPQARIRGDLQYSQNSNLTFPGGVVVGRITRVPQAIDETGPAPEPTLSDRAAKWAVENVRTLVTLLLLGLLLLWLVPQFMRAQSESIRTQPWKSLGWGVIAYAGFFFLLFVTLTVMILAGIFFGVLTLGGLSATVVWLGIMALFGLILGFVLAVAFLTKIVVGMAVGQWILKSAKSPLAEHRIWPMVIGVLVLVLLLALLTFPSLPGGVAWIVNAAIVLFGLGALLLRLWKSLRPQPAMA